MDSRMFPGIPDSENKIIVACKNYLGIEDMIGRSHDVSACRRIALILLQEYNPKWSFIKITKTMGLNHTTLTYVNKRFTKRYKGEGLFYYFIYLNLKAKLENRIYFFFSDIFEVSALRFPLNAHQKKEGLDILRSEANKDKIHDNVVIGFILYLQKESVSKHEIARFLNINPRAIITGLSSHKKNQYIEAIEKTLKEKIEILITNQEK